MWCAVKEMSLEDSALHRVDKSEIAPNIHCHVKNASISLMVAVDSQVRQLQPNAVNSWWQGGHPGWAIYPVDSEQFIQNGTLDIVSVANEQMMPTSEPEDPGPSFDKYYLPKTAPTRLSAHAAKKKTLNLNLNQYSPSPELTPVAALVIARACCPKAQPHVTVSTICPLSGGPTMCKDYSASFGIEEASYSAPWHSTPITGG